MKSGMKYLIESFYRSIAEGTPVPIPYREILLTARIMDSIFEQIRVVRLAPASSEDRSRGVEASRPGKRGPVAMPGIVGLVTRMPRERAELNCSGWSEHSPRVLLRDGHLDRRVAGRLRRMERARGFLRRRHAAAERARRRRAGLLGRGVPRAGPSVAPESAGTASTPAGPHTSSIWTRRTVRFLRR